MVGINLTEQQKQSIMNAPDEGAESSLPYPSVGNHRFMITNASVKHDDYSAFESLTVTCKCVDEEDTRSMSFSFRSDERGIIDMGHFYARHVLGKKYAGETIEASDLVGVEVMGKVHISKGKNLGADGKFPEYTNLSRYTWVPSEAKETSVSGGLNEPTIEQRAKADVGTVPKASPPKAKIPSVAETAQSKELDDDELNALLNR